MHISHYSMSGFDKKRDWRSSNVFIKPVLRQARPQAIQAKPQKAPRPHLCLLWCFSTTVGAVKWSNFTFLKNYLSSVNNVPLSSARHFDEEDFIVNIGYILYFFGWWWASWLVWLRQRRWLAASEKGRDMPRLCQKWPLWPVSTI